MTRRLNENWIEFWKSFSFRMKYQILQMYSSLQMTFVIQNLKLLKCLKQKFLDQNNVGVCILVLPCICWILFKEKKSS